MKASLKESPADDSYEKQETTNRTAYNHYNDKDSQKVTLLGLTIDNQLTFKEPIGNLCRFASFFVKR